MVTAALVVAFLGQDPELVTLGGRRVSARPDSAGLIALAESAAARHPRDPDTLMALGLARAGRWQYRAAVEAYSRAIALAPDRAVLYRHRGHRYISLRRFDDALADLERAAGLDTTSFDIWYHLGLARFLLRRFDAAGEAYRRCLGVARSADDSVAVSDWLWMSLRRAGREAEAARVLDAIGDSLPVRENTAYYNRLLFYRGRRSEAELQAEMARGDLEFATVGFGLAHWYLLRGDTPRATELFRRVTEGPYWPAFGFIAAEVELRHLEGR